MPSCFAWHDVALGRFVAYLLLSVLGVGAVALPRGVAKGIESGKMCWQYERDNDSWRKMQHLVMQLRKCCNHPYLFPGAEPDFDGHSTGVAHLELCSMLARMGVP